MKQSIFYIALVLLLTNCKKEEGRFIAEKSFYKVTFNLDWNSTNFPIDYPANAHFSRVIGWSHNSGSTFFKEGTIASVGIKDMAERGLITPLDTEITAKISNREGHRLVVGSSLASGLGSIVLDSLEVTKDFPLLSLVSMLAPSPDWYIGVLAVDLHDNNEFLVEKTVDIMVYDAGTDSGVTFSSTDSLTSPQQSVKVFVDAPLGNGVILNKVIGTVTFVKQSEI
tara:strand:- start:5919 stop:6593 length:675 start_codon:yes stop_codon:yes gene_type:complete